jgi:hypothetical protein
VSLGRFLKTVVGLLDEAGVPYMLTGSLAAAYYATPRATQDVDVVIEVEERGLERVVEGMLLEGYYVDRGAAREALRHRGQFNAIDPEVGWKVDLIVRKDRPFSEVEFQRRRSVELFGIEVSLASLEDVLIAKLEWSKLGDSELQRRDVLQLVERAGDRLDRAYVGRWVAELDLESEWVELQRRL